MVPLPQAWVLPQFKLLLPLSERLSTIYLMTHNNFKVTAVETLLSHLFYCSCNLQLPWSKNTVVSSWKKSSLACAL